MHRQIKWKNIWIAGSLALILGGCGVEVQEAEEGRSEIRILSGGALQYTVSEVMDKDYYSVDELKQTAEAEVAEYNEKAGEEEMKLLSCESDGQRMTVSMQFKDYEVFNDYTGSDIYVGTIQGAYDEGIDLNQALIKPGLSTRVVGKSALMNMATSPVVTYVGDYRIVCPGDIRYYTYGMKYLGSNSVEPVEEGSYMVLY